MNLVDLYKSNDQNRALAELVSTVQADLEIVNRSLQESRELIISSRRELQLMSEGLRLLAWRTRLGLSRAYVSRETGVAVDRLRRIEQGLPVREARIINRIYEMLLDRESRIREPHRYTL